MESIIREKNLALLAMIYVEVMAYPPRKPISSDSYLPANLLDLLRDRIVEDTGMSIDAAIAAIL
jgi:hypothetical protein